MSVHERSSNNIVFPILKTSLLQGPSISLQAATACAVFSTGNVRNETASGIQQMCSCDATRHGVVNADKICLKLLEFAIDKDIRLRLKIHALEKLNTRSRRGDH